MRFFLFLICLFGLNTAMAQSMTRDQIWREYNQLKSKKSQMATPLTEAGKVRKANLVPLDKFLPNRNAEKVKLQQAPINVKALPASVDLRSRDTSIKNQGSYPYCTAFAGVAAIENMMQAKGAVYGLDLSEWDAFFLYGQYSCEAFIKALTKTYICDEKEYPQGGKQSANCIPRRYAKIATQIAIGDNADAMRAALARGSVVYIGMATPNDMLSCKAVISPNTTAADGGHALLISGYDTQGTETIGMIKNSWGPKCGDKGYQYMPMSLCRKAGFYCTAWEIAAVDIKGLTPTPTPTKVPTVKPTPTVIPTVLPTPKPPVCTKCKTIWYAPWKCKCVAWE